MNKLIIITFHLGNKNAKPVKVADVSKSVVTYSAIAYNVFNNRESVAKGCF